MDFVLTSQVIDKSEQGDRYRYRYIYIYERKTFALGKYPSLLFEVWFRISGQSIWSVWGPFVAKEVPWAWGCSWHLPSIQYPLDSRAAGCDPHRKTDGIGELDTYCFQQSSTGTNKVAATTARSKSGYSWTRDTKLSIKKDIAKPIILLLKKHLPSQSCFSPHGVNLWDINDPLSCLFNIFFWQCLFRVEAWSFSACVFS